MMSLSIQKLGGLLQHLGNVLESDWLDVDDVGSRGLTHGEPVLVEFQRQNVVLANTTPITT